MSRRSSLNPQDKSLNEIKYKKNTRSKKSNLLFESDEAKECARLKKAFLSRQVLLAITFLCMLYLLYSVSIIEENDNSLKNISYEKIIHMIIIQTSKSMNSIPMQCLFVISLFNLASVIVCQINFPCPKPLFVTLLIQALLSCISILVPDFLVFIFFYMTIWSVFWCLYFCAQKKVSDSCAYIYVGIEIEIQEFLKFSQEELKLQLFLQDYLKYFYRIIEIFIFPSCILKVSEF
jgi:hypothetical protein